VSRREAADITPSRAYADFPVQGQDAQVKPFDRPEDIKVDCSLLGLLTFSSVTHRKIAQRLSFDQVKPLTMTSSIPTSPFNDERPFTVARLQTFSFQKLVNRGAEEQAKLLAAGERDGFFYLDLTEPESKGLWNDYEAVLSVMASWFDQPLDAKTPFAYGSDVQGYDIRCPSYEEDRQ
jgi:hypothetical protein